VRKDGTRFWASVALNAMRDDQGQLIGYAKVTRDLTERKGHEERLRASAEALQQERDRLRTMIQSMKDGVISVDSAGRVVLMNPVAESLTGFSAEQAWRRPVAEVLKLTDADTGDLLANAARLPFEASEPLGLQNQVALLARDGTRRHVRVANAQIRSRDGDLTGAIITFHDISALRAALREIEFSARHDPLTRLPNRREFERKLDKTLREVAEKDIDAALCLVDLDHFKEVNDTGGHQAGDALLREVSTLLSAGVRRRDLLARLGGDEFAIILNDCSIEEAERRLEKIRARIAGFEFRWEEHTFRISASIGIAGITRLCDPASLIKRADDCCYAAKREGKNCIRVARFEDERPPAMLEQLA
jgi:diguanylate cyclase (GGDEF)-like protein/PAS domain S-box-containing protein